MAHPRSPSSITTARPRRRLRAVVFRPELGPRQVHEIPTNGIKEGEVTDSKLQSKDYFRWSLSRLNHLAKVRAAG